MSVWRRRVLAAIAAWVVTVCVMLGLEMRPNPVVLALVVAITATVGFVLIDLSDIAAPVDWATAREADSTRGGDARVRILTRRLEQGGVMGGDSMVHSTLVELIDDELLTAHGVDRSSEPDRAATILGPDLTRLVSEPASSQQLSDPTFLATILDRVESLSPEQP
ncbi:MAG: hypothetical protein ACOYL9_08560 [Ilumatobacteraceae bacterium]